MRESGGDRRVAISTSEETWSGWLLSARVCASTVRVCPVKTTPCRSSAERSIVTKMRAGREWRAAEVALVADEVALEAAHAGAGDVRREFAYGAVVVRVAFGVEARRVGGVAAAVDDEVAADRARRVGARGRVDRGDEAVVCAESVEGGGHRVELHVRRGLHPLLGVLLEENAPRVERGDLDGEARRGEPR